MKVSIVNLPGSCATQAQAKSVLMQDSVSCGFPNPASDHQDRKLDLNELLVRHPAASFFARASGDSMVGKGIFDGDVLIVDRSLTPVQGDVVIAALDGELTCKSIDIRNQRLLGGDESYPPINIPDDISFAIEGVVVSSLRLHRAIRMEGV